MRTIVVTGAANGIGRALCKGFAAAGDRVFGGDVDDAGLTSLAAETENVETRRTDVAQAADVEALIGAAVDSTGCLDLLFNNAGYGLPYEVEAMPDGAFEALVAVHLFGTLYGIRAAIPHMKAAGRGHIINTLSRAGEFHGPRSSAYAAAKAGQWALTRSAAAELKGTGVLVNGIIPGMTNSAIWGRDRPELQQPEAVFEHAEWMASFQGDGPTGKVFWNSKPYRFADPANLKALAK